jgi:hypothetical protein
MREGKLFEIVVALTPPRGFNPAVAFLLDVRE